MGRIRSVALVVLSALLTLMPGGVAAEARQLAQSGTAPLLSRPAHLQVEHATVTAALEELKRTSGVSLAYSPSLLPRDRSVSCACTSATVGEALRTLLGNTRFTWHEGKDEIILLPRRTPPADTPDQVVGSTAALGLTRGILRNDPAPVVTRVEPLPVRVATITGTVTSTAGAPVADALVTLPRTGQTATTNGAGEFRLVVPTDRVVTGPDSLRIERIGYATHVVPFEMREGNIRVDVILTLQAVLLDQLVVTGTVGNQQRRAQPAVVATINAADIMAKAPVTGVTDLLYGRVPGVSITSASGSTGAASRISIRGRASLNLSNDPLVFIDGIRVSAGDRGAAGSVGGQQIDGLSDLNPDDIESIEIVKGPAAATLYGANASAGVIQILTKRGATGQRSMSQTLTVEYQDIDPNFTPDDNYYRCTAADVAPTSGVFLCQGRAAGDVVTDNPLVRQNAFNNGSARLLNYSASGGGQDFGYFFSFGADDEDGTLRNNSLDRRTGRVNFRWSAHPKVTLDAGMGVSRANVKLAMGDQAALGYLIGSGFGTPRTVRQLADGTITGGWLAANTSVEAISSVLNENKSTRITPSGTLRYNPVQWFTNELTVGADYLWQSRTTFYPKNDNNWYSATQNTGQVSSDLIDGVQYSLTYTGNLRRRFGTDQWISTDLSFGSQYIQAISSSVSTAGTGLVTNTANAVSQTSANRTGSDGFGESKQHGLYGQLMLGFHDRLYVKLAERVDRSSAFARNARTFFLPSVGVSYVASAEPMFRSMLPDALSTLKLRAAYGETGRAPGSTAALQTYVRAPYLTDTGVLVVGGVAPGNPGNPDLRPERGTELEGGVDIGLFNDRLGIELTYFDKTSKDLIVTNPLPPSAGFGSNPSANIGELSNTGLELAARANLVQRRSVVWDIAFMMNTLSNKIVHVANVNPINDRRCFKPGIEIAAWCMNRIVSIDTVSGIVTVSDTAEFLGGQMPRREMSVNSTATLFRNFRLYALAEGKFDYLQYNNGAEFRDRLNGANANSRKAVLTREDLGLSAYEFYRLRPNGVRNQSGQTLGLTSMREDYFEDASYVRLREVSLTWTVPPALLQQFRMASGASLTVGGRNLALWTDYTGYDPEVEAVGANGLFRVDLFTVPQTRRLFVRARVNF